MAGRAMERPIIVIMFGTVLGADRVVRAEPQLVDCACKQLRHVLGHAAQTTERTLAARGRGVDQETEAVGLPRPLA